MLVIDLLREFLAKDGKKRRLPSEMDQSPVPVTILY